MRSQPLGQTVGDEIREMLERTGRRSLQPMAAVEAVPHPSASVATLGRSHSHTRLTAFLDRATRVERFRDQRSDVLYPFESSSLGPQSYSAAPAADADTPSRRQPGSAGRTAHTPPSRRPMSTTSSEPTRPTASPRAGRAHAPPPPSAYVLSV
jgi:hypothetical protein